MRARVALLALLATAAIGVSALQSARGDGRPVTRDPRLQPFAATSIWNTPIGTGAAYSAEQAPETRMLRTDDAGGPRKSVIWIGHDVMAIARARENDPLAPWSFGSRAATALWPADGTMANGTVMIRTPPGIRFLGGSDRYVVIIAPDGRTAYEGWHGSASPQTGGYHADYLVRTDLLGSGIARSDGRSEGIRAFGGSLLGGLVRCAELSGGAIPHAIAVNLANSQLKAATSQHGQKVWPATGSDDAGRNGYAGLVPMGSLLAIPPDVDIGQLGLTRDGAALAHAFQDFGGYVVDRAPETMVLAQVEAGCPTSDLVKDRMKIARHLTIVTNNGPAHPGGPGPRRRPPPPPVAP